MRFKSDDQRKAMFAKKKFYHGSAGFRGRVIGADGLIPPSQIDMPTSKDEMRGPEFDDYVFLTTDKDLAKTHAERRARHWEDTEYGPIVYEVELDELEVVPDTFDPVRYPDSFKYKGIIPREKVKRVKFSEDSNKRYFLTEDEELSDELHSAIRDDEERLLHLFVDWTNKSDVRDEFDRMYAGHVGHKGGGMTRSRKTASDRYNNVLNDVLSKHNLDMNDDINRTNISVHLMRLAKKRGLFRENEFSRNPKFVKPDNIENPQDYVPVKVNVEKFNEYWKKNPDNYFEKESVALEDRYEGVKKEVEKSDKIYMPEVYAKPGSVPGMDAVDVADGRHRSASVRDLGFKTMEIFVPKHQKEWFEERMGV